MCIDDFDSALLDTTKELFILKRKDKNETYKKISLETGIEETWLKHFANNTLNHPSVKRVERLYNYLSGKKLVELL